MLMFICQDTAYQNMFLQRQQPPNANYATIDEYSADNYVFEIVSYSDAIAGDPPQDSGE